MDISHSWCWSKWVFFFITCILCNVTFTTQQTTVSSDCNRFFDTSPSTFSSPGYPDQYSHNLECHYRAETSEGKVVLLTFVSFDVEADDVCQYDYTVVYDGRTDDAEKIAVMCGGVLPYSVYSTGKDMLVVFVTDGSVSQRGFEANFTFVNASSAPDTVPCDLPDHSFINGYESQTLPNGHTGVLECVDGYIPSTGDIELHQCVNGSLIPPFQCNVLDCNLNLNASESYFTSPGYPNPYSPNLDCTYGANALPGYIVQLTFSSFHVYKTDFCRYHAVLVYDGNTPEDELIATFCGDDIPYAVYSTGNTMLVTFKSNSYGFVYTGFEAVFNFLNASHVPFSVPCNLSDHSFIDGYESQTLPNGHTGVLECEDGYIPSTGDIELHQCVNGSFIPPFQCHVLDCNLNFNASDSYFTSPGYPNPYSPNLDCAYGAKAAAGYIVQLTFSSFHVYESDFCNSHAVLVYDGETPADELIATFCGVDIPHAVYSTGNTMLVTFKSNTYGFAFKGFEAVFNFLNASHVPFFVPCNFPDNSHVDDYDPEQVPHGHTVVLECDDGYIPSTAEVAFHQCVNGSFVPPFQCDITDCNGIYFNTSGSTFTSPGYPKHYGLDMDCSYKAEAVQGYVVQLSFNTFEVAHHVECDHHTVSVYDGGITHGQLIAKLCGSRIPYSMYSTENAMTVTFKTNSYEGFIYDGFEGVFNFVNTSSVPLEEPCFLPNNTLFEVPGNEPVSSRHTAVLRCDAGYLPPGPDTYQCVDGSFKPELQCNSTGCSDYFTTSPSFFNSPGYPNYYEYLECFYTAVAPSGFIVSVTFTSFEIEDSDSCGLHDYVWVYDGNTTQGEPVAQFCESYLPEPVLSTGNTMVVSITTDHYPGVGGVGFEAYFTFIEEESIPVADSCFPPQNASFVNYPAEQVPHSHTVEMRCNDGFLPTGYIIRQCVNGTFHPFLSCNSTGCIEHVISSPGFFSSLGVPIYNKYMQCSYSAEASIGNVIALTFTAFAVDKSELCETDAIKVFDGISKKDNQIAILCGSEVPCVILSSGNKMLVTFTSDYYTYSNSFGFEAFFTFLDNSTTSYEECYPPEFAHFVSHSSPSIPHGHTAELECDESNIPTERIFRQCCNGTFTPLLQCTPSQTTSKIFTTQETTNLQTTTNRVTTVLATTNAQSTHLGTTKIPDVQSTAMEFTTFRPTLPGTTSVIQSTSVVTPAQESTEIETTFKATTDIATATMETPTLTTSTAGVTTVLSTIVSTIQYEATTYNTPKVGTTLHQMISSTVSPTIDPCTKSYNKTLGVFESPGNGSAYFNDLSCNYETVAPQGKIVVLFFETFELQPDPLCRFDVLKVYNRLTETDELIAMFCGFEVPESVVGLGREMLVTFETDERKSYEGFLALFTFMNSSEAPDKQPCIIPENTHIKNKENSMIPHSHTAVLVCNEGFRPEEPVNSQCVDGNFRPPLICFKGESYLQRRYVMPHMSSGIEPVMYNIGFMDIDLTNTTFIHVQTSSDDSHFTFFGGVINSYEHVLPEVFFDGVERSTIVIESTNIVYLYVSTATLKSQYFAYPIDWLGTDYIISTSSSSPNPSFIITATEVDTKVSVFFSHDFRVNDVTYNFEKDMRRSFSELQSFFIKTPFDPSGTYVKASKPVAIMMDLRKQDSFTLEEYSSSFFVPPISKWGTSYSFASSANTTFSFSITAANDNTMVTVSAHPLSCGGGEEHYFLDSWNETKISHYNNCLISVQSNQAILVLLTECPDDNVCNTMVIPSTDRAVKGQPGVPVFTSHDSSGANLRVLITNGDYDSLRVNDDQNYYWEVVGEASEYDTVIVETLVDPGYHVVSSSNEKSRMLVTVDKKLYAAYEDMEEQNSMCPFDRMYYSGVELTFSATHFGHTAMSMEVCKTSNSPLAARNCTNEDWEDPLLLACYSETEISEELDRLANEDVTKDNVDEVASEVALLTSQKPEQLSSTDVDNVADSLDAIAETGSSSPDVTNSLVGTVNNLMEVDEAQLEEAEDTHVVVLSLELQVSNVQKNVDNFTEVEDNVGVKAVKIDPSVTNAITFVNLAPEDTEVSERLYADLAENNTILFNNEEEVQKENTITSIYLPPKILQMAREVDQNMVQVPFSFFIYKDSRLFQTNTPKEKTEGNMTVREEIVSQVIAATLENITIDSLAPKDAVITRFVTEDINRDVNILERTCVFWEVNEDDRGTGTWSEEGCFMMSNESNHNQTVCKCTHLTSFAVLFRVGNTTYEAVRSLELITIIGTSLSVAGLTACVLTMALIKRLRVKQPTKIHINLCLCLIAFYVTFLAGDLTIGKKSQCRIMTTVTHFFCLTTVAWTCAEAVNMYFLFVKYSRSNMKYFLPASCIFCYGLPLVPALAVCFLDPTDLKDYCFLHPGPSLYYGLLLEILLMVIFNIVVFSLVIRRVVFRPMLSTKAQSNKKEEIISRMQQFILFWILLGLSWSFGFLVAIPNRPSITFEVLFCIFVSLQGFILFLFICVKNPEVRKTFKNTKRRFTKKEGYKSKNIPVSSSISDAQSKTEPKLTDMKLWDKNVATSEESDLPGFQLAVTSSTLTGADQSKRDELTIEESQKEDYTTIAEPEGIRLNGIKEDQYLLE